MLLMRESDFLILSAIEFGPPACGMIVLYMTRYDHAGKECDDDADDAEIVLVDIMDNGEN